MQSPIVKIIGGVAGLVLVVVGILKVVQGVKEIAGAGGNTELQEKVSKGDLVIDEGNKLTTEGAALYETLVKASEELAPAELRNKHRADAEKVAKDFGAAAEKYREASRLYTEASKLKINEKLAEFLTLKSSSIEKLAETKDNVRKFAETLLDDSIVDTSALTAKLELIFAAINAASAESDKLDEQATKVTTDNPKVFGGNK